MLRRPTNANRTDPLFPSPPLFRSAAAGGAFRAGASVARLGPRRPAAAIDGGGPDGANGAGTGRAWPAGLAGISAGDRLLAGRHRARPRAAEIGRAHV